MRETLIFSTISFIVTFLSLPVIILIADKKKLYDIPDERKLHKSAISSLGGVGIFIGAFFSLLLVSFYKQSIELYPVFAAIFLMFFTGLKDDIIALSAGKKLISQLIAAALVIHISGLRINNFYGLAGIYEIPEVISYLLTYITIILIINAYNLIDGVDGLAGSLGVLGCTIFGIYFYFSGEKAYALTAFCFGASFLSFLIYNFHPAKIFMGDCGSLTLGLLMSVFALKFLAVSGTSSSIIPLSANIVVAISILIIPITDTLRVFAIRIFNGRSPFSPDRNHIHHLLCACGLNHGGIVITCITVNLLILGLVLSLNEYGNNIALASVTALLLIGIYALHYFSTKAKKDIQPQPSATQILNLSNSSKLIKEEDLTKESIKN